jgi:hypothetical protein
MRDEELAAEDSIKGGDEIDSRTRAVAQSRCPVNKQREMDLRALALNRLYLLLFLPSVVTYYIKYVLWPLFFIMVKKKTGKRSIKKETCVLIEQNLKRQLKEREKEREQPAKNEMSQA